MNKRIKSFIRYQLPAILWAGAIFLASSIPAGRLTWSLLHRFDKLIHIGIFFVLGLLVYRALQGSPGLTMTATRRTVLMLLIVLGYGLFDEIHQGTTPGRSVDVKDFLADATGGALAAASAYIHRRLTGVERRGG